MIDSNFYLIFHNQNPHPQTTPPFLRGARGNLKYSEGEISADLDELEGIWG